jgi:hypothetical protein
VYPPRVGPMEQVTDVAHVEFLGLTIGYPYQLVYYLT